VDNKKRRGFVWRSCDFRAPANHPDRSADCSGSGPIAHLPFDGRSMQATIHEELVLASFLIDGDPPKINVGRQAVPVVERV
jgi:hypothetical protein